MKFDLASWLPTAVGRAVLVAGVCFGAACSAPGQDVVVRYQITEIGGLPTSPDCNCFAASGISASGIVTGIYVGPGNAARGFVWQDGVTRDVGGAAGTEHTPLAVNDDAAAVGYGGLLGFRAHAGQVDNLLTLGGTDSKASDVNNAGQIVGSASNRDGSRAAMWIGTNPIDLGTLGGELSEALGINRFGQVVGWSWNQQHDKLAFIWDVDNGMRALPLPFPDATLMEAVSINDRGDAVGTADVLRESSPGIFQHQLRGYLWTADGPVIDLGDLAPPADPALFITPTAINDSRQAVGLVTVGQNPTVPFLWENGAMQDLNTLIDPAAGWRLFSVKDINNRGQIAATGVSTSDGRKRALLLTPLCAGDFNNSGAVSIDDVFDFLAAYFSQDPRADVDRSGSISVQDVFVFLTAYFQGCR